MGRLGIILFASLIALNTNAGLESCKNLSKQVDLNTCASSALKESNNKFNKVYVGYILRISKPLLTQQIEIVPIVSGYRKSETKKVQFTTPYFSTYRKLSTDHGFDFTEEETAVILPKEKIISVSRFYPIVYQEFQEQMQLIGNNQAEE